MQKPLPLTRIIRNTCTIILLCSIHLPVFSQVIHVSPSGSNTTGNGSAGNPYQTITYGIAMASAGNTVQLAAGTYNELVVIDKSVTIDGVSNSQAIVNYTGTISNYTNTGTVLPTLFKVTAQNVVIRNIRFMVNTNIVHSAVHTSGDASGLQVLNNDIRASASGIQFSPAAITALAYARRNAIALNPNIALGASKYTFVNPGITGIKVAGNFISGTTAAMNGWYDINFRAGVHADNVSGLVVGGTVAEKNILQTINQDVLVRFAINGDITIRNNELNGGGVEVSTINGATGTVMIDSNYFNYLPPVVPDFPLLRLMSNSAGKNTIVRGNTFYNHNWFINLANYNSVLVDSNIFTPIIRDAAANNDFRLITVNSKAIQSSAISKVVNNATFTRNEFNGVASANGTAMAFYNHDATGSSFGIFTVGETGDENFFHTGITRFFYVDNSNGQSTTSMTGLYPEYGSGIFNTTTAWWAQNILASQNWYDIGTGPMRPDTMDWSQRATLNGRVTDRLDNANLGLVFLYNVLLASHPRNAAPVVAAQQPASAWQVYPNPVSAVLHVRANTRKQEPVQVKLFHMSGYCLQTTHGTSNKDIQLPIARWPAGIYTVELVTSAGRHVHQVIKQ
ncbi:T9SS type A sorting domain-containing protein [Pseudoflavitalea sp. X16]|uniref:T9SS type A sorting domain-containing protein n=1 Tax=Paraflavitalea devenefica TaxID=2716334 RepID=UPI00141DB42A|nr:T9SS type A sorting domain-containing protein [Paraflavitalea devenefica]NII25621.1 T9SS type A sorting domain-containing protein [Paraflavitalea devenefica]